MSTTPNLILTREAFCKLLYFARRISHEVSCFGIAADPDNIFRITDFEVMPAKATSGNVILDDHAIAMWMYEAGKRGLNNDQSLRVYFHTQPGTAVPSLVDFKTFYEDLLPQTSWMIMGVISFGGDMSALMGSIVNGCILRCKMKVGIDWEADCPLDEWKKAVTSNIIDVPLPAPKATSVSWNRRDNRRFLSNGKPNPHFINWDDVDRHRAAALPINANNPLNQHGIEFGGRTYGPYDFEALNQARFNRAVRGGDVAADDPRLFIDSNDDPILLEGEAARALAVKTLNDNQKAATIYADIGKDIRDEAATIAAAAATTTAPRLKAKPPNKHRRRGRRRR